MKVALIIGIIIAVVVLIWCLRSRREGFTISERDGILCPPFLNERDAGIMPSSVVWVIQGYNYQDTPKIFRDGKVVVPLQYAWDYANMAYYFTVYAPKGVCGSQWMLETSDFVKPIVNEGRSEKLMTVTLARRRAGYHHWTLSC